MKTMPNDSEILMIRESVILPLVLTAFDRDAKIIAATVKTPGPYVSAIERAMNRITADLASHRRYFRSNDIKLYDAERTPDGGITALYIYRKYQRNFTMIPETLRVEAELYMRRYLGEDISKFVRKDLPEHLTVLNIDKVNKTHL